MKLQLDSLGSRKYSQKGQNPPKYIPKVHLVDIFLENPLR